MEAESSVEGTKKLLQEEKGKILISQSTIKLINDYRYEDECGHVVQAKLKGTYPYAPSAAMNQGVYFEYLLFNTVPQWHRKNNTKPEPEWLKNKQTLAKPIEERTTEDMTSIYRIITAAANKTKTYLKKMGVKVLDNNVFMKNEGEGICGEYDARVKAIVFGGEAIIDCKWTGAFSDKWSKWGWALEMPKQIQFHGIQAKHYHLLTGLPFYYLVVGTNKVEAEEEEKQILDIKFIKAEFDAAGIEEHRKLINETRYIIEENNALESWEPKPEVKKCEKCPLYENCNDRAWYPSIIPVKF